MKEATSIKSAVDMTVPIDWTSDAPSLDTGFLAIRWSTTRECVQSMNRRDILPAPRMIGRMMRWSPADIAAYERSCRAEAEAKRATKLATEPRLVK